MPKPITKILTTKVYLLFAVIIIISFATILYFVFIKEPNNSSSVIPSSTPNKDSGTSQSDYSNNASDSGGSGSGTESANKNEKQSTSSGSEKLIKPTGQFISNHFPGGDSPTSETSVCNTSPGAECYIEFSNEGKKKQLQPQITDVNGSTYWNWDIKTAGLTKGTWTVTAVAKLNDTTLSATDALKLEVQE